MIALLSLALALEPEVGIHADVGLSNTGDGIPLLFGAGGQVAIDPLRRLHLELAADAGLTTAGYIWLGVGPRARLFAGAPEKTVLSAYVGGGLAVGVRGPRPLVEGGFAVDLLKSPGPRPRIQVGYAWEVNSASRLLISAGVVVGRKAPEPFVAPPESEPVVAVAPDPAPRTVLEEGMIWVPGPACRWLPTDEAGAEIERLGMTLESYTVLNARALLADGDPSATRSDGPIPGRIAITASAADRVQVDGNAYRVKDGLAVLEHAEGRADVRVVGGGRQLDFTVGVVEDNVVWVDAAPPEHTRVLFASGSPLLDAAARERIAAFARNLGDWSVTLYGSYSPDGNEDSNRVLAQTRADAVRAELLAAGIPEARILVGPVQPPAEGLDPTEARNATLAPVEAP